MAAHESQSLIIEMQACRSDPFLHFLGGELYAAFGGDKAAYATENLAAHWRHVSRGFIRVDADELTYPAHVILRFRLERALIGGTLEVADLPAAWNAGFEALLGIAPPDDARGCLQDIHWSAGGIGYFPTYTLGNMYAAQFMSQARAELGDLDGDLQSNAFEFFHGTDPTVFSASGDTDNDGLPDAWELAKFGNLNQTAAGDPDRDGVNNLAEYLAGSDPNNPNSVPGDLNGTIFRTHGSWQISAAQISGPTTTRMVMATTTPLNLFLAAARRMPPCIRHGFRRVCLYSAIPS
jgi:hypothetical protein